MVFPMWKKIEIRNFQSHKKTVINLNEGITAITGESDNGKSAVVRAIRWLIENRPSGTGKLNSWWNKSFNEPMSVRLYVNDNDYVERIRKDTSNGYNICKDGVTTELSAIGTDVPIEVIEFLNISDVNVQYQFDQPYLISMSAGEASKYLNRIIHLDSIDECLSLAESSKRSSVSEEKVVESDINSLKKYLEDNEWLLDCKNISLRIEKYDEKLSHINNEIETLRSDVGEYESVKNDIVDVSIMKKLMEEIDAIEVPDCTELDSSIKYYEMLESEIIDTSKMNKLMNEIDDFDIVSTEELSQSIVLFESLINEIEDLKNKKDELIKLMPETCPYCGAVIDKECACS